MNDGGVGDVVATIDQRKGEAKTRRKPAAREAGNAQRPEGLRLTLSLVTRARADLYSCATNFKAAELMQ